MITKEEFSKLSEDHYFWCPICAWKYKKRELDYWDGDDRGHWLCPGCNDDLVESWSIDGEYYEQFGD